jgi:tRNA(Arg) A34 adenosine deaminase TadA
MTDADAMQLALDQARAGIAAAQSPFGAVIVRAGAVVAAAHNTVWRTTDPTAHAEVNTIRAAAPALGTIFLHGCTMYTSCEPCPMCLAAIHWAKIDRVVYAAAIADAAAAGFSELALPAADLARRGGSPLVVEAGPLRAEGRELFEAWRRAGLARPY